MNIYNYGKLSTFFPMKTKNWTENERNVDESFSTRSLRKLFKETTTMEFSLNVFTEFAEFSDKNFFKK